MGNKIPIVLGIYKVIVAPISASQSAVPGYAHRSVLSETQVNSLEVIHSSIVLRDREF